MAALSKGALRTITRALLRDNEKQAWHDSILDIIIGQSLDSLASNILDFAPDTFFARQIIPAGTFDPDNGTYNLTLLNNRFFKMTSVVRNRQEFYPVGDASITLDPTVNGPSGVVTAPTFSYSIRGNSIWLFPFDNTQSVVLTYNYLPTDFLTLADTTSIDWPQGFEMIIAHDAAAQIVDDEFRTTKFTNLRNEKLDALYSKVKRQYSGPGVQNGVDDGLAWSSI